MVYIIRKCKRFKVKFNVWLRSYEIKNNIYDLNTYEKIKYHIKHIPEIISEIGLIIRLTIYKHSMHRTCHG